MPVGNRMMASALQILSASFQLAAGLPAQLPPACHCVGLLGRALGRASEYVRVRALQAGVTSVSEDS